jgi:hypothetical protein
MGIGNLIRQCKALYGALPIKVGWSHWYRPFV